MGRQATLFVVFLMLVFASAQNTLPPGAPSSLTVQFIIRDHVGVYDSSKPAGANGTTHRDFERINAQDPGIVNNILGSDRKPVLNSTVISKTWTNATLFNQVWNDVPGVNYRLVRNFIMTWNTANGLYEYNNSSFFPINNDGFGNYGTTGKNFHFCLEYHTQFKYNGNERFQFTGDDDVYFFVNNRLFVDLGGVHGAISVSRDLTTADAAQQFGLTIGNVYNFDFFFCERHTSASNLRMSTNILLDDCPYLDACGYCTKTQPVSLVNPCTTLQCGNGTCVCGNASCLCKPGWVNGPLGNCSQFCGDGIIQGSEQCDGGACCTSTCTFANAGTSCPSQGRPCISYTCTGTSSTCGVPKPIGSTCTGSGVAPQCQQYQCTAADGSTCALTANNSLTCSDNNACTTDVCNNGACVSTNQPCQATACRLAGTCNPSNGQCNLGTPRADGTGCGADPGPDSCVWPTCQSGTCTNTSKPNNTPCNPGDSSDGCSTTVCTNGNCGAVPIANAQSTAANCPAPSPGSCLISVCSGLSCSNVPIQDGSTCTNSSLSPNSCQRLGCLNGVCALFSIREGQTCSDNGALNNYGNDACSQQTCQSGQCVKAANTSLNGNGCNIDASGVNPEPYCSSYTCSAGVCTRANVNESQTCAKTSTTPNACQQLLCQQGTCTLLSANSGGQCQAATNEGCTIYRCDSNGACLSQTVTDGISCNNTDLCSPKFCSGGSCVAQPVDCGPGCGGNLQCQAGVCKLMPSAPPGACCGNEQVDPGEQCDNPTDPCCVGCQWAAVDVQCSPDQCNLATCQLKPSAAPQTYCVDNLQPTSTTCTDAPPVTNQCQELRCDGLGDCTVQNKADQTACALSGVGFCAHAVCVSGNCSIVADPAKNDADCSSEYGTVPQCNRAACSGTSCILKPINNLGACTALTDVACRSQRCESGQCVYNFDAFPARQVCTGPVSSTTCQFAGCDGVGNCVLQNSTADLACTLPSNPECNTPVCDGNGGCYLKPINIGSACTAARDQACQTSSCDNNGNCVVSNVPDNTTCTRTDVSQCEDSVCISGACALRNVTVTNRPCTPAPNPLEDRSCFDYFCTLSGTCDVPTNKADGSSCADENLCDTDTCVAGTCNHQASVACNTPTLPCQAPLGTCNPLFGNCTYTGRGQYAACTPRDFELDSRCNASNVGDYRCATGAPDSSCVPSCFSGGVCGDGIVQIGEDCDWGDPRTGGPCCNITCKWYTELTPCNNTDPAVVVSINAQIDNLTRTTELPEICFVQRCVFESSKSVCTFGLDTSVSSKCTPNSRSSNNRTAILASVIPGALAAACLAGLGFYLWRRAQKAAEQEWLQEYLNAGNVRVENNAAFVETQTSVNNAAFQPDGNN